MGSIGYPETSVQKYHSTLRSIAEERRYHLHSGGSLKPRSYYVVTFSFGRSKSEDGDGLCLRNVVRYIYIHKGKVHPITCLEDTEEVNATPRPLYPRE
jgi:hypothetical protein